MGWLNEERERKESLTDIRKTAEDTGTGVEELQWGEFCSGRV